jgi:hypothetical protein
MARRLHGDEPELQFEHLWTLTVTGGSNSDAPGSIVSNPGGITCNWMPGAPCTDTALFLNGATVQLTVTLGPGATRVAWGGACTGTTGSVCDVFMDQDKSVLADTFRTLTVTGPKAPGGALLWTTQLDAAGAEGHVAVNGALSAVRTGRNPMRSARAEGVSLVEATLSRGAGAGTWRFDFSGQPGFKRGSLRAVAGKVALLTADSIAFALEGKAGERMVFTFETEP